MAEQSAAKRMTAALKRHLVPALKSAGFAGTFPRYRRLLDGGIQFLLIAYDKPGRTVFLEFGAHPRGDKLTAWGEIVPEEKLLLEHVLFTSRARLQARCEGGSLPDQWFAFGDFGDDDARYDDLAVSIAGMMTQMEHWFAQGVCGPNVSPNGP